MNSTKETEPTSIIRRTKGQREKSPGQGWGRVCGVWVADAAVRLRIEDIEGCSLWGLFSDCLSIPVSQLCVQKRMGWSTENVDLILDPLLKRKWAWVAALSSAPSSMAPHPWPA